MQAQRGQSHTHLMKRGAGPHYKALVLLNTVLAQEETYMSTTEKLPDLYGEGEATRRLYISKTTLTRERIAGRIHPIRISTRIYRYSNQILEEYIQQCRNVLEKSGIIGSASALVPKIGAALSLMLLPDKQTAHLFAQRIFKKRK